MKILHTESSPGWGGQELRILREAEGMRQRGHEIILAVQEGGGLVKPARESGFPVYELPFKKTTFGYTLFQLMKLMRAQRFDIINTHSSMDSWLAGSIGKLFRCPTIRTRHLSTPIQKGLNIRLLYNFLADTVITTCAESAATIAKDAGLGAKRCFSIPTGIDPQSVTYRPEDAAKFRKEHGIEPDECLVGTLCVLRGWKGVSDLLLAAKQLEHVLKLKWIIVGSGASESFFRQQQKELGLEKKVIFTGHLFPPFTALGAMDIFLLLSWAHEGVSQASLQAALLKKPLITTETGGLKEVCIADKTGLIVPKQSPESVAKAVLKLAYDPNLCAKMGQNAQELVLSNFTLDHMLDQTEQVYFNLVKK